MEEERTVEDVIVDEMLREIGKLSGLAEGSEEHHKGVKDIKVFMDDLNNRSKEEREWDKLERDTKLKEKELEIKAKELELKEKELEQDKERSMWKAIADVAVEVGKIGAETGISLLAMYLMTRNFDYGLRFEDEGIFSSITARENRNTMNQFLKNRIG